MYKNFDALSTERLVTTINIPPIGMNEAQIEDDIVCFGSAIDGGFSARDDVTDSDGLLQRVFFAGGAVGKPNAGHFNAGRFWADDCEEIVAFAVD